VNVSAFVETVREFNAATKPGVFDPFKLDGLSTDSYVMIPRSNWALPITEALFVAYGVTCGITFTYGGLKTDTQARVLNNEGLPMPGLWAVGEISGGFFAFNHPGDLVVLTLRRSTLKSGVRPQRIMTVTRLLDSLLRRWITRKVMTTRVVEDTLTHVR
jgi:succinate dehydrogenase/fumarate reductase flavoprotein subunit